jgi:copper chaperone CopZ
MKIEVLYFEGCPNHKPAVELARDLARELAVPAEVVEVEVVTPDDAKRLRFLGSPSIRIDGVDVEREARHRTDFGFTCRLYSGKGLPNREVVVAAIRSSNAAEEPEAPAETGGSNSTGTALATVGSLVSAIAASACCWVPLLLIAFGVSAAGVSSAFETLRPVFLGLTVLFLGIAFYRAYFRQTACAPGTSCPVPRWQRFNRAMLWVATGFVIVFALFPNYVGRLVAWRGESAVTSSDTATTVFTVKGMDCEGCKVGVEQAIKRVSGVLSAKVDYPSGRAEVMTDVNQPVPAEAILAALKKAGFPGEVAGQPTDPTP